MDQAGIESAAKELAARFLENGNFTYAGPLAGPGQQVIAAAAIRHTVDEYFEQVGFAGLAVQSVGYERDRKDDQPPRIHVYVTKGSRKAELDLGDSTD